MESKAKLLGHSAHQLLIVFPLGLLATAVIFDGVFLATGKDTMALVAYWMIVAGVIGGLASAPFGLIDWLAIPRGTRLDGRPGPRPGQRRGAVTVRRELVAPGRRAVGRLARASALSFAGAGLAVVTGWLGGELVSRLGVGVYDGAHLNSPNSLSGRPARRTWRSHAGEGPA